jgi:hypothetical protein
MKNTKTDNAELDSDSQDSVKLIVAESQSTLANSTLNGGPSTAQDKHNMFHPQQDIED